MGCFCGASKNNKVGPKVQKSATQTRFTILVLGPKSSGKSHLIQSHKRQLGQEGRTATVGSAKILPTLGYDLQIIRLKKGIKERLKGDRAIDDLFFEELGGEPSLKALWSHYLNSPQPLDSLPAFLELLSSSGSNSLNQPNPSSLSSSSQNEINKVNRLLPVLIAVDKGSEVDDVVKLCGGDVGDGKKFKVVVKEELEMVDGQINCLRWLIEKCGNGQPKESLLASRRLSI